jgi:hypothetical protein
MNSPISDIRLTNGGVSLAANALIAYIMRDVQGESS